MKTWTVRRRAGRWVPTLALIVVLLGSTSCSSDGSEAQPERSDPNLNAASIPQDPIGVGLTGELWTSGGGAER